MLTSIVLPTCDREALLGRAIRSVIAQDYPDWELIVINDGGRELSDARAEFIDPRIRWIRTSGYTGVSAARNTGIASANSETWLAFLDDDDEFQPSYLSQMQSLMAAQALDFAWCGTVDDRGSLVLWDINSRQPHSLKFTVEIAASCGLMLRHDALKKHGSFDISLRTSEDRDLVFRLISVGCSYGSLPLALVRVHSHPGMRLSNVRQDRERAVASALDDERLMQKYADLIAKDAELGRKYCYALAGKYFHANHKEGFWRVFNAIPMRWRFNIKLLRRALQMF